MPQFDFKAYRDATLVPESLRNTLEFRTRGGGKYYFWLCVPSADVRWSVAVTQAITSAIVGIDTSVAISTMIEKDLIFVK